MQLSLKNHIGSLIWGYAISFIVVLLF